MRACVRVEYSLDLMMLYGEANGQAERGTSASMDLINGWKEETPCPASLPCPALSTYSPHLR